jgi:hypothetical protein
MSEGLARADALLWLAQAPGAAPPPTSGAAHWVSYTGGAAILLAIVLILLAGGFAYAEKRLRAPLAVTHPGATAAGFMIAIWLLAIYTVIVATFVYGLQVREAYPGFVAARVRVGTFVDAPVTFFIVLYLTWRWGWKIALASAVVGTAAAPMIFELPFDLIVMTRTNPELPTHSMLYRQLFFLPLFLAELSTLSLLTLLPSMRVTAYAAYAVAGMFAVFAVWAAFGFSFPAEPLPHFKDSVLRSRDHAVRVEGGQGCRRIRNMSDFPIVFRLTMFMICSISRRNSQSHRQFAFPDVPRFVSHRYSAVFVAVLWLLSRCYFALREPRAAPNQIDRSVRYKERWQRRLCLRQQKLGRRWTGLARKAHSSPNECVSREGEHVGARCTVRRSGELAVERA